MRRLCLPPPPRLAAAVTDLHPAQTAASVSRLPPVSSESIRSHSSRLCASALAKVLFPAPGRPASTTNKGTCAPRRRRGLLLAGVAATVADVTASSIRRPPSPSTCAASRRFDRALSRHATPFSQSGRRLTHASNSRQAAVQSRCLAALEAATPRDCHSCSVSSSYLEAPWPYIALRSFWGHSGAGATSASPPSRRQTCAFCTSKRAVTKDKSLGSPWP
mmetsp:Transcript_13384/g.39127  ORF Transcript_13384/g.39127 Transcript_13384/m.39127 type:complete len:219 (-) Transcript_13384:1254-1910(-)